MDKQSISQKIKQGLFPGMVKDATPAWKFGQGQPIEAKQIITSRINVKNFVSLSAGTIILGTVSAGATLVIKDTLSPQAPHINEQGFAVPYVALFTGTIAQASLQIYPALGGSATYTDYTISAAFDYQALSTAVPKGVVSVYTTLIHNNQGATGTIAYYSQWKYLQTFSGTQA